MSELINTYRGTIYPWHCDHVGHMNVMYYVGKFDEATWQLFNEAGITPSYLRDNNRGVAAVEQKITYQNELRPGDVIAIYSGVIEIGDKVIRYYHEMHNLETGEVAAKTSLTAVHMDTQSRRACPFPNEIIQQAKQCTLSEHLGQKQRFTKRHIFQN